VPRLPTGPLTLLFTDIEGSTRLLQQLGTRYADLLRECRRLLRQAFRQGNGYEVDTQGDAFFVVFERAGDAISAAIAAQRALFDAHWPDDVMVRVRMGLHSGEPQPAEEGYIGLDVHQAARIMGAAHGGQVLLSQATCELVAPALPEGVALRDLGTYRLKDIAGEHRLYQLVIAGLPADFPPPAALSSHRPFRNLPSPATSFVGREHELAIIGDYLRRTDVRLLTLIGLSGVGKTRLALRAAAEYGELFADGLCFVGLEQLSDAEEVLPAIAQALDIKVAQEPSLAEQMKETLRARSLLLVLDNFEQVFPARTVIADLLATCPMLKVLVTSRVRLHLQAEHLVEVQPLSLPAPESALDLTGLSHYASVALFVQRAQAVAPAFQLTADNAPAVAEICRRLDGIALAIELAAARMRHFSPQRLLAQLEQGVSILQGNAPEVAARQQTLQAAIAWSYNLLSPAEQEVFRRLSVCVGGATTEAIEHICTAAGALDGQVAAILEELVDKSMLQRGEDGRRFWLLQTLREYAGERLAAAGELAATQAAHAAYFLSWVERIVPLLSGAEQANWLDRLDLEYANVRAALEWMLTENEAEPERTEQALRLCVALLVFWEIRGYLPEGLAFTDRALARSQGVTPALRAQALHGAGFLALMLDDRPRAEALLRESQLVFRESGDRQGMANILRLQGNLALVNNQYKIARRLLEEAMTIYRELGESRLTAVTRDALAEVAIAQCDFTQARALLERNLETYQRLKQQFSAAYTRYHLARVLFLSRSEPAQAQQLLEESLSLFREQGNKRFIAYALTILGQMLHQKGEEDRARVMLEESLALFKIVGDRSGTVETLIALARLHEDKGEHEAARPLYEEGWALAWPIGAREQAAAILEGYGQMLAAQGRAAKAVQLWGTAAALRAAIVAPLPPVYRADYLRAVAAARRHLSEEEFQSAWMRGSATPLEQVALDENGS
jgi:predicted ATPase/class 3 adenylate cyclase